MAIPLLIWWLVGWIIMVLLSAHRKWDLNSAWPLSLGALVWPLVVVAVIIMEAFEKRRTQ